MNNEEFERIVQTIPTFNNRVKMLEYRRSLILKITTLETINLGLIQEKAELERGITLLQTIALRDAQLTANEEEE